MQTPFVRLVLVAQSINTSHCAGHEKSRGAAGLGRAKRDHKVDDLALMKLCGVPSLRMTQPVTAEIRHMCTTSPGYRE